MEFAEERVDLAGRADVEVGEDAALHWLRRRSDGSRERVRARRSRVDDGRRAAAEAGRVGFDRQVGDARVDVDVEVDQARDHQPVRWRR